MTEEAFSSNETGIFLKRSVFLVSLINFVLEATGLQSFLAATLTLPQTWGGGISGAL